ncbi:hypothetical protein L1987_53095 [Smallanthus sonchifolius]|uniref:Uncharacterized protein n=1 Tax=Smallanthus sonchifolius TaxID=185202 RepID=A0ACB9EV98_9ASTR|nr:hypothetical protein L1987_53095 [Smallanthus sonchifolius]
MANTRSFASFVTLNIHQSFILLLLHNRCNRRLSLRTLFFIRQLPLHSIPTGIHTAASSSFDRNRRYDVTVSMRKIIGVVGAKELSWALLMYAMCLVRVVNEIHSSTTRKNICLCIMIMLEGAKATTKTVDALRTGAAAMKAMQKANYYKI